jgi:hypothetical protein
VGQHARHRGREVRHRDRRAVLAEWNLDFDDLAGANIVGAAFHNDVLAATLAGAAAGFAVDREPDRNAGGVSTP